MLLFPFKKKDTQGLLVDQKFMNLMQGLRSFPVDVVFPYCILLILVLVKNINYSQGTVPGSNLHQDNLC